jgi:hypothetical protein
MSFTQWGCKGLCSSGPNVASALNSKQETGAAFYTCYVWLPLTLCVARNKTHAINTVLFGKMDALHANTPETLS